MNKQFCNANTNTQLCKPNTNHLERHESLSHTKRDRKVVLVKDGVGKCEGGFRKHVLVWTNAVVRSESIHGNRKENLINCMRSQA